MSRPPRIVVVEDDHDMVELIRALLVGQFAIAGAAADGPAALEEVREKHPDLIILDHYIEGTVTGLELAPRLRAAAPESRILLFSSHDLRAEAAREQSIDGYLNKSEVTRLASQCRELVEGRSHTPDAF